MYAVIGKKIICLHNEQEKESDESVECVSLNFIADILPDYPSAKNRQEKIQLLSVNLLDKEQWNYIKNVLKNGKIAVSKLFKKILIEADYQSDSDKYVFSKAKVQRFPELQELDKKLLQYFILLIKNNPNYLTETGYKSFLYDNLATYVNSAIVSPSSSVVYPMYLAAISDTEFIVGNNIYIDSDEVPDRTDFFTYSIDNEAKEINITSNKKKEALSVIVYLVNLLTDTVKAKYGEPTAVLEKMNKFVELISIWDALKK